MARSALLSPPLCAFPRLLPFPLTRSLDPAAFGLRWHRSLSQPAGGTGPPALEAAAGFGDRPTSYSAVTATHADRSRRQHGRGVRRNQAIGPGGAPLSPTETGRSPRISASRSHSPAKRRSPMAD